MRVRAKKLGYYGSRRYREGQEFELLDRVGLKKIKDGKCEEVEVKAEDQFSESWMEAVDGAEAPKKEFKKKVSKKKAKAKKEEPVFEDDLSDEVI